VFYAAEPVSSPASFSVSDGDEHENESRDGASREEHAKD